MPTLRLAQGPVTKKGTTNANRLIGLVAHGYTPGPTNLTVRTVRGQASRRQIGKFSYLSVDSILDLRVLGAFLCVLCVK
ncbi:MAG: hypothetical protein ACKOGP_07440 [Bacteroidota bacterium]